VNEVLKADPHASTLMDAEGNTLFHHLAANARIAESKPHEAKELLASLLNASGFQVVDAKNRQGLRADVIAQSETPNGIVSNLLHNRSVNWVEPSRQEKPLALLGELTPFPQDWVHMVMDEQRRCFGGVLRGVIPEFQLRRWMDLLINQGPWMKPEGTPRSTIWFVDEDHMDCPYRYSGLCYPATVFPPYMLEIREAVCHACGLSPEDYPNSCNVNIYHDHLSEVGWHSDDEVYFQGLAGDTRIVSFSLGAARDFQWRLQGTTEVVGTASLGDGDIMTMEGLFQKHYKHAVPAGDLPCGTRINLTFRWIRTKNQAEDAGIVGKK
jgi:alkylated DNA repair dioxygenase AlkB